MAIKSEKIEGKLILNEYNDSKELYDLEKDPDENENLIGTGLEIEKVLWTELVRIQNDT